MKSTNVLQQEVRKILDLAGQYFHHRLHNQSLQVLNLLIHDLRIILHQVILNHFLPLSLDQSKEFRAALVDQLMNVYGQFDGEPAQREDKTHCHSFIQQVLHSFELAEQIKEEIPHDPVTQKILALDIPILRPFDYGFPSAKQPLKKAT